MGLLKNFFGRVKKKENLVEKQDRRPGSQSCPFCWGYEEYDGESMNRTYDKQKDVKNHRDKHVKVGKFMVEHVDGFKNKKRIIERCPKCGGKRIRYKEK